MLGRLTPDFTPRPRYDVLIVGAGAAGITLALTLAAKGRSVFLAEGGGVDWEDRSQDVYRGTVRGDAYHPLEVIRLRYFGGTTNHWAGVVRPLDAVDFLAKPAAPLAVWPIHKEDLDPYDAGARRFVRAGPQPPDAPLPDSTQLRSLGWCHTDPVRFGEAYRAQIEAQPAIHALLDCNLVSLPLMGGKVEAAEFRNWEGASITVRADQVVLACGGIETPRVLMIENARSGGQIFPETGPLGRYYMDHPRDLAATFVVLDPTILKPEPGTPDVAWGLSEAFVRRHTALNASFFLTPPDQTVGMQALKELVCRHPETLGEAVRRVRGTPPACTSGLVLIQWEQEPLATNRLTLNDAVDAFARPRVTLTQRKSALDRRTAETAMMTLARYMARRNIGRAKLAPWIVDRNLPFPDSGPISAIHLLGGARMADSPARGVVDANLRVHGFANLYCVGGATFPAGGQANPTFTIVQLALRLADRLNAQAKPAATRSAGASPARATP